MPKINSSPCSLSTWWELIILVIMKVVFYITFSNSPKVLQIELEIICFEQELSYLKRRISAYKLGKNLVE